MNNRVFRRTAIFSITMIGAFVFALGRPCPAKEDTAHLIFKKKAVLSQEAETYTYTIKKADRLLDIIRDELGITKHRLSLIRQYNPEITDPDRIRAGQKLILPLGPRKVFLQSLGKGEGPVPSLEAETKRGIIQPGEGVPMASRLALMQAVLGRMNASMMTSGRYIVPLPEIGQMTVDCSVIPVVEFDDGSVAFLDFRNQIPESIRKLIRRHWTNYAAVTVNSKDATLAILARAVNISKSYGMTKPKHDPLFGESPSVRLHADWLVSRKSGGGAKEIPIQAIMIVKSSEARIPEPVTAFLAKNQLVLAEIAGDTALSPLPAASVEAALSSSMPRLNTRSPAELVFDLLTRLGREPVKNQDIQIFDPAKDGFNLIITADIQVQKGPKRIVFVSKKLPGQFADILREKNTQVVELPENASPRAVIEKTLAVLEVPYTTIPYMFPVSPNPDLGAVKIIFPTIRFMNQKDQPCYLIDFEMDRGLYGLLHGKMEFDIIAY